MYPPFKILTLRNASQASSMQGAIALSILRKILEAISNPSVPLDPSRI